MPISNPFRTDPQLGPALTSVVDAPAHYDGQQITEPSYQLGQVHQGSDGYNYIWVVAGGTLAAEADLDIEDETFVATSGGGSGAWIVPAELEDGVTEGQFFHAREADAGYTSGS